MCLCGKKFSEEIFSDLTNLNKKPSQKIRDGFDLCGQ